MLARQATLACQKALSELTARTAFAATAVNGRRGLSTTSAVLDHPRVLITGGLGQLGMPLARVLR